MSLAPNHKHFERKWSSELRAEEAELNRCERVAADLRARQFRCEQLFWRLRGVDSAQALRIAMCAWDFDGKHWTGIDVSRVKGW
jgi:hypothetical protein